MKKIDHNGFWQIEDNPISKEGVFPYYGAQISAELEPERIYQVYRPREELKKAAESFKNVPILNNHEMIGAEYTPADNVKEHGNLGEKIYEEDGVLYGNMIIRTEELKDLIESGKKELSLGYKCEYELTPGVWNGQPYDAVQRNLQGNHIALVEQGRMGHSVRVMDSGIGFACDAMDIVLDDKFKEAEHPRDNGGKFTDKSQAGGASGKAEQNAGEPNRQVIEVKGTELGDYKDIKELRKKAVEYYKTHLQGKTVEHPKLGKVMFSRKGMKKFQHTSVSEDKLKLLPAVADIIRLGQYQGREDLSRDRDDGIIYFHRINADVNKDNKSFYVSVLVYEDEAGNKFYNINPDAGKYKKEEVL